MRGGESVAGLLGSLAIALAAITVGSAPPYPAGITAEAQDVEANTALVREIQFMLLRLGMDPGPIDGIVGPQTLSAVRKFQARSGLPISDLINNGKISAVFLTRLRGEASRAILGGEKKTGGFSGGRDPVPGCGGTGPAGCSAARPVCCMLLQSQRLPNRRNRVYSGQISASGLRRLDSARGGELEGPPRRSTPACRKPRWFCARRSAAASARFELL